MKAKFLFILLLMLILADCSSLRAVSTNELMMIATATQLPTETSAQISSLTPTPTSDFACWKKERECKIAKSLGVRIEQVDSFSPDMKWAVIYDIHFAKTPPGKDIGGLRFVKTDGSKEWNFDSTQMSQDIGECSLFFETNFWSSDSRYIYFSPDPSYCSRMKNFSDVGTQVLYRLDIETGKSEEYLPFIKSVLPGGYQRWGLYTFEISPDRLHLVYFQSFASPLFIKVRDLTTGNEMAYDLDDKYFEAGCPVWMNDNQHILFYAATTTDPKRPTEASLFMINLKQQSIRQIYYDLPNVYCVLRDSYYWEKIPKGQDLVPIKEMDTDYSRVIEQFYLNPFTGQKYPWVTHTP